MEFLHFQDLIKEDGEVNYYFLPLEDFKRHAAPATTKEYVEYREKVLEFMAARNNRMGEWVRRNHRDIEVRVGLRCPLGQAVH